MKKMLVLGLSACLLFSFTGSAFAASQTTASHAKKHATISKKSTAHTVKHAKKKIASSAAGLNHTKAKKHAVSAKIKKTTAVHKKAVKTAKTA